MLMDNCYWNSNGTYQEHLDRLWDLIPIMGEVADPENNKALEKFRIAQNVYYDLYNNGLCNRAKQFKGVFGFACGEYRYYSGKGVRRSVEYADGIYPRVERAMDVIIKLALIEQGLTNFPLIDQA